MIKWEKDEARKIKHRILVWLRTKQRCAFIATEAGAYNSDCLGCNEKRMIEVEVKISISDLKADFNKWKHRHYAKADPESDLSRRWTPNKFYFAVPTALVEEAKKVLENKSDPFFNTYYGIINADTLLIEKRAKDLHKAEPQTAAKFTIALRMGSELLRFHEAML